MLQTESHKANVAERQGLNPLVPRRSGFQLISAITPTTVYRRGHDNRSGDVAIPVTYAPTAISRCRYHDCRCVDPTMSPAHETNWPVTPQRGIT